MKVSDYIVNFLIDKKIKHVFGYPGGMVTHLMDSFSKCAGQINAHVCYHEQAAAFEACAYAQASNKTGVAYATSGPGATNMITGICNAYFDSIPVIFITGQVNTNESNRAYSMRQRGFQETDICGMVQRVTKEAMYVEKADMIGYCLERAYWIANEGRKGPVLLDIPMDIQRSEIDPDKLARYCAHESENWPANYDIILDRIQKSNRPCIILGNGVKAVSQDQVLDFVEHMNIPCVTSMLAIDLLPRTHRLNYGFIGAYGERTANFVVARSDLIISLGSRLDVRQVGGKRENFAPEAVIIRVDTDRGELEYQIRKDEIDIHADVQDVIEFLQEKYKDENKLVQWHDVCRQIHDRLENLDDRKCNCFVKRISEIIPENTLITTDVGQNQVWVAQSFEVKTGQKILFSGGHGAMGYSLPAAIGGYYACGKPTISFNGDGGIQMNIQELEFVHREKLPIKIFVFNNYALGMIRHFQEMYFEGNYAQTVESQGYATPDFEKIAGAYEIPYIRYENVEDISDEFMKIEGPVLIEVILEEDTYVFPKLEFGKPNQDQEPLLDRELYDYLMQLG